MKDRGENRHKLKLERIRHEIEVCLHSSLREEEWEDLVTEHYVEEVLEGSLLSSEVADKVRHRRQVYGQDEVKSSKVTRKKPSRYSEALSLLIAQEASKDREVQEFRREASDDGMPIFSEHVHIWIQHHAREDGLHTLWLTIPVPREYIDEVMQGTSSDVQPLRLEIPVREVLEDFDLRLLSYSVPWSQEVRKTPTFVDGILERLRQLSERLAQEYGWTEAQATTFALTGETPNISLIDHTRKHRKLPELPLIVLTVDPTVSPRDVAEYYRKVRQEVIGVRHRDLSDKHMQLALFNARQTENGTWIEKMAEWNRTQCVEWRYEEVANFAHDCLQARRRLLHLEKEYTSKSDENPDDRNNENK